MRQLNIYNQNSKNKTLPQIFNFECNRIRIVIDEQGEPWFIAKDIAIILDYRKASHATRLLDEYEKSKHIIPTNGGLQKLNTINKSGLYSLVFASRNSKAKRFKNWLTSKVFPTIRGSNWNDNKTDSCDQRQLRQIFIQHCLKVS